MNEIERVARAMEAESEFCADAIGPTNMRKLATAAIAAMREEPVGWQPIETAPKDGAEIFLHCHGSTRPKIGSWRVDGLMSEIERVARASLIDELALAIDQFLTHQIERDTLACDLTPSELTELATGVAAIAAMRGEPDRATDAENQRLRAEVEALREDCRKLLENEPVATCESCGAWLLDGDDYVTDPDGVAGCWASMTDVPSKTERKCYAYRVDKCDARQHLSDNAEAIAGGE